jgi:hypothetical protein
MTSAIPDAEVIGKHLGITKLMETKGQELFYM